MATDIPIIETRNTKIIPFSDAVTLTFDPWPRKLFFESTILTIVQANF